MNSSYIKALVVIGAIVGIIYLFFVPFQDYRITSVADNYFDLLQERKLDSLQLMSTSEQNKIDSEFVNNALAKYTSLSFTNRDIQIIEHTTTDAVVQVRLVLRATNANNDILTETVVYELQMKKALNTRQEDVWMVVSRTQLN